MKLVKINKNTYINPERIDSIEYYPSVNVTNVVINGYTIRLEDTPIKKVLDAISGSEEHLDDYRKKYNFIYFYYDSDFKKVPIIVGSNSNLQEILFITDEEKKTYKNLIPNSKKMYVAVNGQNYVVSLGRA